MSCYDTYYTNEGPRRCTEEQNCPDCRIGELEALLREAASAMETLFPDLALRIREELQK